MYWSLIAVSLVVLVGLAARAALADEGKFTVASAQTQLQFYHGEDDFAAHMAQRVQAAMKSKPDLIVFPEDLGITLVVLGEQDALAGVKTLPDAIKAIVARHIAEIGPLCAKYKVSPQRGLFLVKAAEVKRIYRDTFTRLARENTVHIVAGSVPMKFQYSPSAVYNVACLFTPRGRMHIVARKVNLIDLEQAQGLDLSPARPEDSRVFNVGGVTMGCLVCMDAWDAAMAKRLVKKGAQVLVQVSANPSLWTKEEQARWRKSVWTRVQELGVYGVTCMGVGELVGLPFQGVSQIVAPKAWTKDGSGVIAQAGTATEEAMVVATLDMSRVKTGGGR
jgi:predicted amidohydrolase